MIDLTTYNHSGKDDGRLGWPYGLSRAFFTLTCNSAILFIFGGKKVLFVLTALTFMLLSPGHGLFLSFFLWAFFRGAPGRVGVTEKRNRDTLLRKV